MYFLLSTPPKTFCIVIPAFFAMSVKFTSGPEAAFGGCVVAAGACACAKKGRAHNEISKEIARRKFFVTTGSGPKRDLPIAPDPDLNLTTQHLRAMQARRN
jgi:hypothetical protein